MGDNKTKGEQRMYKVLNRRAANKLSTGSRDKEINQGIDDEENSKNQQDKIQEARKRKDWKAVRKLSETWKATTGYGK